MSASEVRQRHARRLASARYHRACSSKPACHVYGDNNDLVSVPKQQRSARLISSPESVIYSTMLEQCRSLAVALRIAARRIVKACYIWCDFKRADESALLNAAIREMKLCFGYGFGSRSCSTLIGLLNPGGHSIKYFENRESGVRNCNIEMDDEIAFKCITLSKTIVIENADAAKKIGAHFRELSQTPFPLFCTPLRAKFGHSVGILAVDNLCSDAATLHGNISDPVHCNRLGTCEDYHERLAPFVDRNDELCKRVKLWKLKGISFKNKRDNSSAAQIICGHIFQAYWRKSTGLVYSIYWEDGSRDAEVSFRVMKELIRLTPAVLAVGAPCDTAVLGFIEYAGKAIGEHLIRLRSIVHIKNVMAVPRLTGSTVADLYCIGLESSMRFILSARYAEIWEFDKSRFIRIIARMGQSLEIQRVSTQRRLLEIPGHEKQAFWDHVSTRRAFIMPCANEILVVPFCNRIKQTQKGLLLVITNATGLLDSKHIIFLTSLGSALATANVRMNLRRTRENLRAVALGRTELLCTDSFSPVNDLQATISSAIVQCLPASNVSLGLAKDQTIDQCARGSSAVSFMRLLCASVGGVTLAKQREAPVEQEQDELQPGACVEVKLGNVWHSAVIKGDRGHLHYDIQYDGKDWLGRFEQEAGVPVTRIRRIAAVHRDNLPGGLVIAYSADDVCSRPRMMASLCCNRGVMCIDSWSRGNPEPEHDEPLIAHFLKQVGHYLGAAIDDKIRGSSLRFLNSVFSQRSLKSPSEVIRTCLSQIYKSSICTKYPRLCELLTLTDGCNTLQCDVAREMVRRCKAILEEGVHKGTILIQASVQHTAFLSIFEGSKQKSSPLVLVSPQLSIFCTFWLRSPPVFFSYDCDGLNVV